MPTWDLGAPGLRLLPVSAPATEQLEKLRGAIDALNLDGTFHCISSQPGLALGRRTESHLENYTELGAGNFCRDRCCANT